MATQCAYSWEGVLRRRVAQGRKCCQLGASVWPPSCWRQARWPLRPVFTRVITSSGEVCAMATRSLTQRQAATNPSTDAR
jgi:hypothetical protein